jgi:apolipoprotein N-acyltransferase
MHIPTELIEFRTANSGSSRPTVTVVTTAGTTVQSPQNRCLSECNPGSSLAGERVLAIWLVVLSGTIGGLGWSGELSLSWLPLLFPFVYSLMSRKRYAAAAAAAYYGAATHPIVPATIGYLGHSVSAVLYGLLFWAIATICGSLPWILLYSRRRSHLSAVAALILLAMPPVSLITVGYPLTASGRCFPGWLWLGLLLPIVALVLFRKPFRTAIALSCMAMALTAHVSFQPPNSDATIIPVNTSVGNPRLTDRSLLERTSAVFATALTHPGNVLLYPEGSLSLWSRSADSYWQDLLEQMRAQHTAVIFGSNLPIPYSRADYNVLITRGDGVHGAYIQRIPVPFMMWQPGMSRQGYPLQLGAFPYMDVRGHRAAVLLCYEQLLAWPAIQSMAARPELLLAPSNQYWAKDTDIPAIQHAAVQNWADLFRIPLYEAHNR